MSLTNYVNNRTSALWQMLRQNGGDEKLFEFCNKIKLPPTAYRRFCAANDAALVGMAMRYAIQWILGSNHLKDGPISKSHEENFEKILTSFGEDIPSGFLMMALLDKTHRGGELNRFEYELYQSGNYKNRGIREFSTSNQDRLKAILMDIDQLIVSSQTHFTQVSTRYKPMTCPYCETTQIPETKKAWLCTSCGGQLIYDPKLVSSISVAMPYVKRSDYKIELIPTYAGYIGGADAPLVINHQLFSIRCVKNNVVTPEHVLMAFGWWALWSEEECPPWQTATIYYARQEAELTFEFQAMRKMLDFNIEQFHEELEDAYERKREYEYSGWEDFFQHEDWGDRN